MIIEVVILVSSESRIPLFPQYIIAIAGKEAKIRLVNASKTTFSIKQCPPCIKPQHMFVDGNDIVLTILGKTYQPEPDVLVFSAGEGDDVEDIPVKVRTLTDHELFVVFCMEQLAPIEKTVHDANLPISWLLDLQAAVDLAARVVEWHGQHGDSYAVLLPDLDASLSADETRSLLQAARDQIIRSFEVSGFPRYASVVGSRQTAIGSALVKASADAGLKGIWGIAWDQNCYEPGTCNRGAPWDVYKPSRYQMRIPARENEQNDLFIFPESTVDLLNAIHLSPRGASIFCTNLGTKPSKSLIHQARPNYLMELLRSSADNMKRNDFLTFVVHIPARGPEEDINAIQEYIGNFVNQISAEGPSGTTYATLEEIAQWLAIKYPDNEVPKQVLELNDPLEPATRLAIRDEYLTDIQDLYDPASPDELEQIMNEHFPASKLPPHVAFYDRDMMFVGYRPHRIPTAFYNYRTPEEWLIAEDGQYPQTILPKVVILDEQRAEGYTLKIVSDRFFSGLPWIVWNPPFAIDQGTPKSEAIQTENAAIFFLNVQAGENEFDLSGKLE
jgi:hypothetical protein